MDENDGNKDDPALPVILPGIHIDLLKAYGNIMRVREQERKLPAYALAHHSGERANFHRVLNQTKNSTNKIYSVHNIGFFRVD